MFLRGWGITSIWFSQQGDLKPSTVTLFVPWYPSWIKKPLLKTQCVCVGVLGFASIYVSRSRGCVLVTKRFGMGGALGHLALGWMGIGGVPESCLDLIWDRWRRKGGGTSPWEGSGWFSLDIQISVTAVMTQGVWSGPCQQYYAYLAMGKSDSCLGSPPAITILMRQEICGAGRVLPGNHFPWYYLMGSWDPRILCLNGLWAPCQGLCRLIYGSLLLGTHLASGLHTLRSKGGHLDRALMFRLRCPRACVGGPWCRLVGAVGGEREGPGPWGRVPHNTLPCYCQPLWGGWDSKINPDFPDHFKGMFAKIGEHIVFVCWLDL